MALSENNEYMVYIIDNRMCVDSAARTVSDLHSNNALVKLSKMQFDILLYLCENSGIAMEYDRIINRIDQNEYGAITKPVLQTTFSRMMGKLKTQFEEEFLNDILENIRGVGYELIGTCIRKEKATLITNIPDTQTQEPVHAVKEASNAISSALEKSSYIRLSLPAPGEPMVYQGMPLSFPVFYALVIVDNTPVRNKYETVRFLLTGKKKYSDTLMFDGYFTDEKIRQYLKGLKILSVDMKERILSPGFAVIKDRIRQIQLFEAKRRRQFIEIQFGNQMFVCGKDAPEDALNKAMKADTDLSFLTHLMIYSIQEDRPIRTEVIEFLHRECLEYCDGNDISDV